MSIVFGFLFVSSLSFQLFLDLLYFDFCGFF